MQPTLRVIALIPARSGSKRVPDKNIRSLAGHPLIAYSIAAAYASEVFTDIIVSTDSEEYAAIARYYGAEVPFLRPVDIAGDQSPDIEWVDHTLTHLQSHGREYDCFSILRPTSPFRQPETIKRAWGEFISRAEVDSLRAVEKCSQHPGKMWVVRGDVMYPLLPISPREQPWHSSQYPSLPEVYVQNASLEIAWSQVVFEKHTIAGDLIMPFFTTQYEGFDVNSEYDWKLAEEMVTRRRAHLPQIVKAPYADAENRADGCP
jgi:CMP-N,N'-diacetyllegionaminic acid synthase